MKLKANDTLLISSVKSENILAGEQFEVGDVQGKSLVERGLAIEVKAAKPAANKMAKAPSNKAAAAPRKKGR